MSKLKIGFTKKEFQEIHKKLQDVISKLDELRISYNDLDHNDRLENAISELSTFNTELWYKVKE